MFLRYNLFPILWALIIMLLTVMPGTEMPALTLWELFSFDKFAHMFVFAVQVFLLIVGFSKQYTFQYLREHAQSSALTICITYGLLIEIFQGMVPGRSLELLDFLADTIGCFIGWGLFYLIYKL